MNITNEIYGPKLKFQKIIIDLNSNFEKPLNLNAKFHFKIFNVEVSQSL